jgi:hypothetical protein
MEMQADSGDKPRGTVRRLAREATIFALLGMLVACIGTFVMADAQDKAAARNQAAVAVHAGVDWFAAHAPTAPAAPTVQVPLTNGTVLQIRACELPTLPPGFTLDPEMEKALAEQNHCRFFSLADEPKGWRLASVPLGNADQVAIEKDYWAAYKNSRHQHLAGEMSWSLFLGLWGFLAGLGLWIFYRLVYFAVRG